MDINRKMILYFNMIKTVQFRFFVVFSLILIFHISFIKTRYFHLEEGTIVGFRSIPFSNVYLRLDGRSCGINGQPCGIINGQFGQTSMEKFIAHRVRRNKYCFESSEFLGTYLALDPSSCIKYEDTGCGMAYAFKLGIGQCSGDMLFKIVNVDNSSIGLQSYENRKVFLRLDGRGVTSFQGNGGGYVNGQYNYDRIPKPNSWETFSITFTTTEQYLPMREGMIIGINSRQFPNIYLRMDARNCATVGLPCGLVNAQFTQGPLDKFIIHNVYQNTFCFESRQNRGVYLALDPSNCFKFEGNGCGRAYALRKGYGQCSGDLLFNIVMVDNYSFGLQSAQKLTVYLRIDGRGLTRFLNTGGGFVNGQFYPLGSKPTGYEVFTQIINYR